MDNAVDSGRVAIIGIACRVRGVETPEQFWDAVVNGRDTYACVDEAQLRALGVAQRDLDDPDYVRATRSLLGIEDFDAGFFGVTPRDARYMDPQQRVFLECCHEALEAAGYPPGGAPMSVGVFAGSGTSTYMLSNILPGADAHNPLEVLYEHARGNDKDYLTTVVSYKFNLTGPSMSINAACSTALISVVQACKALLAHECDMALAGGVRIELPGGVGYRHHKGGILSADGKCFAFDATAQGTIWADGAGVVLLKRLEDALADGDFIYATIDSFATNNDGSAKAGYSSPGPEGQEAVLAEALAFADIEPQAVGYIEAHGTGTRVGDPVEFGALSRVYTPTADGRAYCALGSLKANFGHLTTAAGVAGLIKAALALHHKTLPPQINFNTINPEIGLAGSAFHIPTTPQPWLQRRGDERRAAVSSFGIGGSNAHVILREAPVRPAAADADQPQLLIVSAHSAQALQEQVQRLQQHLAAQPQQALADVAFTLQQGRRALPHRASFVASDCAQATAALVAAPAVGEPVGTAPALVFMLPGQGSQYAAMGHGLYRTQPVYRAAVDRCLDALGAQAQPVREVLFAADAGDAVRATAVTQPAMFVVEYALAQLWISWGLRPDAMIGHSLGEYVAACLAGVMSLEDALNLVMIRGRLMQALAPGAMLAVATGAPELAAYLEADCEIAASNSPGNAVAAGPEAAIAALAERLERAGIPVKRLETSHAFHCALVEPAIAPLREALARIALAPPQCAYVSNVTGTWITAAQATSIDYWIEHLRRPVRFSEGLTQILQRHERCVLIEVGPGGALSQLARKQPARAARVLDSLRQSAADESTHLLASLGQAWCAGAAVDWDAVRRGLPRRRVPLPTCAFQRTRHWVEPQLGVPRMATPAVGRHAELARWFYLPSFKRVAAPPLPPHVAQDVLLYCDAHSAPLAHGLRAQGHRVIEAWPANAWRGGDGRFELDPHSRDDHQRLVEALRAADFRPSSVVYAWDVVPDARWQDSSDVSASASRTGTALIALLHIAQSLKDGDVAIGAQLRVICGTAFAVLGSERVDPDAGALVGASRVMADELEHLQTQAIDFDPTHAQAWPTLLRELQLPLEHRVVALRADRRWIEHFESTPLPAPAALPQVRSGATYLLTGGLGGVGKAIAQWLAATPGVQLVLLGRQTLPERSQWPAVLAAAETAPRLREDLNFLCALEAQGARVAYLAADITQAQAAHSAVAQAVAQFGGIDGVFHLAGVPSTATIHAKTADAVAATLAPKVQGTLHLHAALATQRPEFVVLFSSMAAVMGGVGQFEYSAGNAYLDAFAQRMNGVNGCRWLSVNWDAWREAGMAVNAVVPEYLKQFKADELELAITHAEGAQALARMLASDEAQYIVSTRDITGRRRTAAQAAPLRDGTGTAARPSHGPAFASAQSDTERRLATIWSRLFGYEQVGRHDNFFELGGDSLLATKAVATINAELGVELSVRDLLESKDVEELGRLVDALGSSAEEAANQELVEEVW